MRQTGSSLSHSEDDGKTRPFRAPIDPRAIIQISQLRRYLSVLTIGNIILALLHIAKSLSLAALIVGIITGRQKNFSHIEFLLIITLIIFGSLTVVNGLCAVYSEHQPDKLGAELAIDRAFRRLISLPEQLFTRFRPQFQAGVAMQSESIRPYLTEFIPALVSTFVLVPIVIIAITYVDWLSGIIILVLLPCIPIFMVLIGQLTSEKSQEKVAKMENLTSSVADTYAGVSTLQALGRSHAADKFLEKISARYAEISQQISSIVFLSSAILEFIATFSVAIVAVNIGMRLIYGKISLDAAVFVFIIIAEVYIPLRKVGSAYHASEEGRIYIENMLSIPEVSEVSTKISHLEVLGDSYVEQKTPNLDDQSLSQSNTQPEYLLDLTRPLIRITPFRVLWKDCSILMFEVDFTVYSGSILVFRGDNGGGKTTLLRAILGEVTTDPPMTASDISMTMLYLPVNPLVMTGTIAETYLALTPWLSLSEMCEPLSRLGLLNFIEHYDFSADISELSLGQRQFLFVCRVLSIAAIRAQAEQIILLLDEPLQFLDQKHAMVLENACQVLASTGVTIIIASHDTERLTNFPSIEIGAVIDVAEVIQETEEVAQFL